MTTRFVILHYTLVINFCQYPIINSSIPLFVETTGNILKTETIETHREIAEAIAEHNAVRAKDAMYMHLMYNKRCINSSK